MKTKLKSMKKLILFLLIIPFALSGFSQVTDAEKALKAPPAEGENGWTKGLKVAVNLSQVSLTNWAAGGQNSLAVNGLLNSFLNFKKDKYSWENNLDMGYGIIKQGTKAFFKADDKLEFNSKFGYKLSEKISVGELINFKTQMAPGYPSPEDMTLISDLLAPGYFIGAIGLDFKTSENFSLYVSPVASKMTFVMNEALSEAGAFGVDPGKNVRGEFGGYIRMAYQRDIMENVNFQTKLDLFSNYLDNPQYIDVNWDVLVMLKINKWLSASINTQLKYDHDIEIGKDTNDDGELDDFGPRVQFKELIGVGLAFSL